MSISKMLTKLLTEKEIRKNIKKRVEEIAQDTDSWYDFIDVLTYEYDFSIKDGDLRDIGIHDLDDAIDFWKDHSEGEVWKVYPDSIDDVNVSLGSTRVNIEYDNSIPGEARTRGETIYLSDRFLDFVDLDDPVSDEVLEILYHEIGHLLHENSRSIKKWISKNPEGCLGKYNISKGYWDGISHNITESWAQAFAMYYVRSNDLRNNFPKAYDFVETIADQVSARNLIDDVVREYLNFLDGMF